MEHTISTLVAARIAAKQSEDAAVQARRDIDTQLAELLRDPAKTEGTVSQKVDGYKVVATYGMTRKADTEKLQAAWQSLPLTLQCAFRWKPEVSTSELRKLDAAQQLIVSKFIETKPASPSIKIELA